MCTDFRINCLSCWRARRLQLLIIFSGSNGWSTCELTVTAEQTAGKSLSRRLTSLLIYHTNFLTAEAVNCKCQNGWLNINTSTSRKWKNVIIQALSTYRKLTIILVFSLLKQTLISLVFIMETAVQHLQEINSRPYAPSVYFHEESQPQQASCHCRNTA